jgi:hypothetical protein
VIVTYLITYVSKLGHIQSTVNRAVTIFNIFDVMIVKIVLPIRPAKQCASCQKRARGLNKKASPSLPSPPPPISLPSCPLPFPFLFHSPSLPVTRLSPSSRGPGVKPPGKIFEILYARTRILVHFLYQISEGRNSCFGVKMCQF